MRRPISWLDWLRHGPFLAQLIVTRRCNLSCGYCSEYDHRSSPIPFAILRERLQHLRALRTWAVSLMGGEPTLHPDLVRIVSEMRALKFRRRMMTTNGVLLTPELVDGLNEAGLTDMSLSVDGVSRNAITVKVLDTLRKPLAVLAERARFEVVLSAVVGSAPREEVVRVGEFATAHGFPLRILLLHNVAGQLGLSPEDLAAYAHLTRFVSRRARREAHNYRERLIRDGAAPFRCRAGARYLYVDEFGMVRWCAQTRAVFGKPLAHYTVDDLRQEFGRGKACSAKCCVGCVRTVSAVDQWRAQTPVRV